MIRPRSTECLAFGLALAIAGAASAAGAQEPSGEPAAQNAQAQSAPDRGPADRSVQSSGASSTPQLDFEGSYSAPSALPTTDTGHVSAHPPSPPPAHRLLRVEMGPSLEPPWHDQPAAPGGQLPERDQLWSSAIKAWQAGDLVKARDRLAVLARSQPDEPGVWFLLGGVALDEARTTSLAKAVAAASSPPTAVAAPPVAPLYERRPAGPSNGYSPAASHTPLQQDALELAAELDQLESVPDTSDVLERRFRAALALRDAAYRRAAVSPQYRPYLRAIHALATQEWGNTPAAEREYRAALAEDPESAVLHAGLGRLLRQRLKLKAAQEELARAESLDATDPEVAFELGDVDQRLGDPAGALPLLTRALELDPQLLLAHWSRAKVYLALGDDAKALADFEAAAPADSTGEIARQIARLNRRMSRGGKEANSRQ